ncbi:outer membrane lipoprotein carrier protein LolA [Fulvivirgaceae bacterium BMA12]|uniref:Outer membrane lipoprotein carrier protein LolA n=1 Tax=Agaribacillus aureus TaxID=3051825 RepID=A0ABT8L3G8_9BACT|nr:outer membrane lipoprotein carrier protein LolA [Fulvivirgaceae bacterium BMA12]
MKKILIIVLLLLGYGGAANAQYDAKAKKVLDAMSSKYKSISSFKAKISQHLENEEEDIDEKFNGEITVKGEMFKLMLAGQEIYNNGSTVWTYLEEVNEVNIDNYDPEDGETNPSTIYNAYKDGYKYIYLKSQNMSGKGYDVVDLIPEDKNLQFFKIRMVIDQQDKLLKSWKMFDKNGNRYEYSITAFDSAFNVNNDYFKFDPKKYPGVEIIDLR